MIHTVKGFSIVSEAEVDIFLDFLCFLYDPMDVGSLISCSSVFSKPSLYIWKFSVHVLLKIMEKAREFQKTSISALLTMPKPLTVWITINCGKSWNRWEYQTTWPAFWEIYMQVMKQQLELDMEQQTGSK